MIFLLYRYGHCVPYKFSAAGPCKITNILGFKNPCLRFNGLVFFGSLCFIQGNYFNWFFACFVPVSTCSVAEDLN
jgi:hypothetical protein